MNGNQEINNNGNYGVSNKINIIGDNHQEINDGAYGDHY